MSESRNSTLEMDNLPRQSLFSNFQNKNKTLRGLASIALLLILIGMSLFIFLKPKQVAPFPKIPLSSHRRLESMPEPYCELDKPLDCVPPLRKMIESGWIEKNQTDVANIFTDRLTVRNQDLFFKSHHHKNIIQSAEDLLARFSKHRQCATDVTLPTLGICSVQRGTGPYIQEWLSFYLLHGVSKFFIYDNSLPNTTERAHFQDAVKPFVKAGFVDVRDWSEGYNQLGASNDCLQKAKSSFDWLAFFDCDEYLIIKEPGPTCLPEFLGGYKEFPGIVIKWKVFTPRGVVRHNFSSLFLEQYFWTDPLRREGKYILQTRFEINLTSPHTLRFQDGNSSVCPSKQVCPTHDYSKNPYEHAELRHYWGVDWGFTFYQKLCGKGDEHQYAMGYRLRVILRWLVTDCCVILEEKTRQESSLRSFLFG